MFSREDNANYYSHVYVESFSTLVSEHYSGIWKLEFFENTFNEKCNRRIAINHLEQK